MSESSGSKKRSILRPFQRKARKIGLSRYDEIVSDYGEVLEKYSHMVYGRPKSKLPHDISEIKEAILKVALNNLDEPAYLKALKAAYIELAIYINDDVAMRLDRFRVAIEEGASPESLKAIAELGPELNRVQAEIIEEVRTYATVFDEVMKRLKVKIN